MSREVPNSGLTPELSCSIDEPSTATEALSADTANVTSHILSRMEMSGSDFELEVFEQLRHADSKIELENNFEAMTVGLEKNTNAAEKMNDFNRGVFDGFEFGENA